MTGRKKERRERKDEPGSGVTEADRQQTQEYL